MKTIIAIIIMITVALFIWFIRLTKPDHKKKLKIVHRSPAGTLAA